MPLLPRTIRLDPSDTLVFERAAEPGEWAVPGGFAFWDEAPEAMPGKRRQAFRAGFLGLASFGWSTLVEVAEATPEQDEADFARLAALGVRGLRYNLHRRARFGPGEAARHAARAARFGLHAEIYCDAARLAPHVAALAGLPRLALDHLGLSEAGLPVTCDLARAGAKVKATGFGRVSLDVPRALEAIARAAPDSLMAGTDLPSTRAARPFRPDDLALLREVLGPLAAAAFADTAWAFYRAFPPPPRATRP